MENAFKLFDFMGTPVYLKYWFFAILLFIGFDISLFIAIFVAVMVHELSHTFIARKFNYFVSAVHLDLFYGAAQVDTAYQYRHNHSLMIVGAGPLSNLIMLGIGTLILIQFPDLKFIIDLNKINWLLFIFNILPIYPLDGGRMTKAFFCLLLGKINTPQANKKGKFYNGILSMVTSIALLIFCLISSLFLLAIFSLLFIYMSYQEIIDKNHF
jgi:stage IV sporulation protein FB